MKRLQDIKRKLNEVADMGGEWTGRADNLLADFEKLMVQTNSTGDRGLGKLQALAEDVPEFRPMANNLRNTLIKVDDIVDDVRDAVNKYKSKYQNK